MRILSIGEVAAKTGLAVSTIYEKVREGSFPAPIPIGATRRRGYVEEEIDSYLAACAAKREMPSARESAPGRAKFWADVRAGLRPHPRTEGKRRRQALDHPPVVPGDWAVRYSNDRGGSGEQRVMTETEARTRADSLRASGWPHVVVQRVR